MEKSKREIKISIENAAKDISNAINWLKDTDLDTTTVAALEREVTYLTGLYEGWERGESENGRLCPF